MCVFTDSFVTFNHTLYWLTSLRVGLRERERTGLTLLLRLRLLLHWKSQKDKYISEMLCVCVKICFSVILFLQWAAQSRLGNTNCICPQGHVRHIYIHFEYCILIIRFSFFVEMLLGCKHNIVTAYIFYLIFY